MNLIDIAEAAVKREMENCIRTQPDDLVRYVIDYAAQAVLDALFDPSNRDALVAELVEAGAIEPAGCWDAPPVSDEIVVAAYARVGEADRQYDKLCVEWTDAGHPNPSAMATALKKATKDLRAAEAELARLLAIRDHTTVYYEDEDRPDGAVPLYRVKPVEP